MPQKTQTEHFDIIVIGAGSGGLTMAAVAAQLSYKVALLEAGDMGGDCLNTGCVPSKALLAAAKAAQTARDSKIFGITATPKVSMQAVHDHVHSVIQTIEPHDSQERFEGLGVTVIREFGFFMDKNTIGTPNGRRLKGRRVIIATGSRAMVPPIKGLEGTGYLTNETIFNLNKHPKHLLIAGGGAIGAEMAQAFNRLGSKVTLIEGAPHILPQEDPDMAQIIHNKLTTEGVEIITNHMLDSVSKSKGAYTLSLKTKGGAVQEVRGSDLLVALGRAPNTEKLNLSKAGVKLDGRFIKVNNTLRTTNKKVFAVGDVVGPYQFTHMAGFQAGQVIKRCLFGAFWSKINYNAVPWCTYTDPELATVGMNETTARKTHGSAVQATWVDLKDNDRAQAERKTEGAVKLITVKGKLKGVTMVAPGAADLIAAWTLALHKKLPVSSLSGMIHPYPSYSDINRHIVSTYYKSIFLSKKTKRISKLLFRLFG